MHAQARPPRNRARQKHSESIGFVHFHPAECKNEFPAKRQAIRLENAPRASRVISLPRPLRCPASSRIHLREMDKKVRWHLTRHRRTQSINLVNAFLYPGSVDEL